MKRPSKISEKELESIYEDAQRLMQENRNDEALVQLKQLNIKAKKIDATIYLGRANSLMGYLYYQRNEMNRAISFYEKGLNIFVKNHEYFITEIKQVKNSLGVLYKIKGEFTKAMEALYDSIEISESYKVPNAIAYNNLGSLFYAQKNYKKAVEYYQLSLDKENLLENPNKIHNYNVRANIAVSYIKLGRLTEAMTIFKHTLKFSKENEADLLEIQSIKGLADIFLLQKDFVNAAIYLNKAILLSTQYDYKVYMIELMMQLSELYNITNDEIAEYKILLKVLSIAEEVKSHNLTSILNKIELFHFRHRNYKEASIVIRRIIILKTSIHEKENRENLLELQNEFESRQKDKLIDQERVFQKKLKMKNRKLQKALAEQRSMDLHLKSLQLQLSPHFIFNTLQSIQSFIFEKDPLQASDYLAKFASLMRANLKASRQGSLSLLEEQRVLSQYLELEQLRFDHCFDYKMNIEAGISLEEIRIPALLIQPFVENAVLHGASKVDKGKIYICFRKKGKTLMVHVIDNGPGRIASMNVKKPKGNSMALKILAARAEHSKDSVHFNFKYRIQDCKRNNELLGTHVALLIENNSVS